MTEDAAEAERPALSPPLTALAGALLFGACRAIQILLDAQATANLVGQALLVEWISGKLGVVWTNPRAPRRTAETAGLLRRAALGAAVGLAIGTTVLGALAVTGGAKVSGVSRVEPAVLAVGLLTSALAAWRDELLLRGIALRIVQATSRSPWMSLAACGLTSGGAALGAPDAGWRSVLAATLLGVILGALWLRDGGAWLPCAAGTAVRFAAATLYAGGVANAKLVGGWFGGESGGLLASGAAVVALLPLAAAAAALSRQTDGSGEYREIPPRVG